MFGNLFRSHKRSLPERPSFRPMLESLESREVPSVADVNAAFNSLPSDMANLQAAMAARPTNANDINVALGTVVNDFTIMRLGRFSFDFPSRLQIDNAFVVDGLTLVYDAFENHAFLHTVPGDNGNFPSLNQFVTIAQTGATAVQTGYRDFLLVGFYPNTTGDAVLT